jgi:hypothetical protein
MVPFLLSEPKPILNAAENIEREMSGRVCQGFCKNHRTKQKLGGKWELRTGMEHPLLQQHVQSRAFVKWQMELENKFHVSTKTGHNL